ncbi:hypothetical protein GO730_17075 [Spirosoma sp. HMF3257]|uniref:Uncharacterized protein n=1 Tax=Spirosoma telluris TaxID=2183553 RepID=A0A327NL16_9BACT|nr:hypothetical protein [Spirosoma telluris]RAI75445.1 hypothetical protein HMF3257_17005 [Spirosoma telluris]
MLTSVQLATLDYHLRETNLLTNEELILELTDHYTTALIERMEQGMTFETALADTQQAFGGRKGLQKMERQYNRVTFRHYDERWKQALLTQFEKPLLWRQTIPVATGLLLVSLIGYSPNPTNGQEVDNDFYNGFANGTLAGFVSLLMSLAWPYIKTVFKYGIHNFPTEALYLITRHSVLLPIVYGIGAMGFFGILSYLPYPIQPVLISLYLMAIGLYMRTGNIMYESLYEVFPNR